MAIIYNVSGAIDLFGRVVVDVLTTAGDTVDTLPQITSAQQVELTLEDLPITILECGEMESRREGTGEYIMVPITVHQIRAMEPGAGNAAETVRNRLTAIAARVRMDYRLWSMMFDGAPAIEDVEVGNIALGDKSTTQHLLNRADQQESMVGASLTVILKWYEFFV